VIGMKKRFLLMTMVLAVGLGSSGCDLSGNCGFETITDGE
jgi:lipoprotein